MHLGVLYQEACSVLIPTGHYLEQRKRVRRVEEATHGLIDREGGRAACRWRCASRDFRSAAEPRIASPMRSLWPPTYFVRE
jgi:transposase